MAAAVAFGFTATSCSDDPDHPDKNVLETPMMQAPQLTSNSATLSWKKCANANMYVYTVNNGPEMMTYEPTVTLEGLTPETTYTFKVKARRDYSEYFEDSEYTTINSPPSKGADACRLPCGYVRRRLGPLVLRV